MSETKHAVQKSSRPPARPDPRDVSAPPVVQLRRVSKHFPAGAGTFVALDQVDLSLAPARLVAVTGSSGSGKSTLLNMVAGLDRPTAGHVLLAGEDLGRLNESALAKFRGAHVGVVFQFFQLLPTLTGLENIQLAMDLVAKVPPRQRAARALSLLERVGIADQAHKFPAALSGGQQQRVAIARALANDPPLVVADEPTGNLDSHSAREVFSLLRELANEGKTVLVVTHERDATVPFDQRVMLRDGRISTENGKEPAACSEGALSCTG